MFRHRVAVSLAAATIDPMENASLPHIHQPIMPLESRVTKRFSLIYGMVLTLAVSGYQFGRGNLTVYLLDGLRLVHPELLRNDWFVTQTLQYHACFSILTEWLMRLHVLAAGFLIGYLALVFLWHLFWRRCVIEIGGDDRAYLISVFLFYLSAAGISVGVFQFLQDGCFLPSNVASVGMLGGIACWISGRRVAAGIWFGVAGLFHVNYAAVIVGLWISLLAWEMLDQYPIGQSFPRILRGIPEQTRHSSTARRTILASFLALGPSLLNISLALPSEFRHGGTMPMGDFVAVYVRFRHTHHFDPLHWPLGLWISFLWAIPFAVWMALRWQADSVLRYAQTEVCRIFALIFFLLVIAFLFAGIWFINEPLVQLCFWRFSIYIKLMSCVGTALLLCDERLLRWTTLSRLLYSITAIAAAGYITFVLMDPAQRGPVWALAYGHRAGIGLVVALWVILAIEQTMKHRTLFHRFAIVILPLAALIAWPHLGVGMTPEPNDAEYRQVCLWAKDPANTPVDSIFLVPPQETDFRLYGERAIVVNFKHVPQLSGEIIQWETRLLDVLGVRNVKSFPHGYTQTMAMIQWLYDHRDAGALIQSAEKYHARFIVVDHSLGTAMDPSVVFHHENNRYFVYDLNALPIQP